MCDVSAVNIFYFPNYFCNSLSSGSVEIGKDDQCKIGKEKLSPQEIKENGKNPKMNL